MLKRAKYLVFLMYLDQVHFVCIRTRVRNTICIQIYVYHIILQYIHIRWSMAESIVLEYERRRK